MRAVTLAALLAAGVSAGVEAQATLPDAAALHTKFVEAVGGRTTIAAQSARRIWGRLSVPSQGIGGPLEIFTAAPNKFFFRAVFPGLGEITQGFDGETAWTINPAVGPLILDGRALEQMRQQADFYGVINPERFVKTAETVAEETFEGKPAYKVKVTTRWEEVYHEYYDKASGLLLGVSRSQSSPMGDLEAVTVLEDYKLMGGLRQPAVTRVKVMGIEQVLTLDSVSVAPIPDSVFALPPAIKALKKPN